MPEQLWSVLPVILLILAAEFVNGWTDAPNSIATVVSTRVLSPQRAVIMATLLNTAGAFSVTAVAATIGKGIVDASIINTTTVAAAMVGIVLWSSLAYYMGGLPTSESHALVAGLAGAGLATAGPSVLLWEGWGKGFIGFLFFSLFGFFWGGRFVFFTGADTGRYESFLDVFRYSLRHLCLSATEAMTDKSSSGFLPWLLSSEESCRSFTFRFGLFYYVRLRWGLQLPWEARKLSALWACDRPSWSRSTGSPQRPPLLWSSQRH